MTRALIAAGAAVNTPNHYGITPLLQGSRSGDAALMGMLIKAGADVAAAHPDGETPLMAASRTGHLDAVKLLIEAGANANVADAYQQETPLMWAASEGHVAVVNELLKAGADPNRQAHVNGISERKHGDHPTGGFTALMFATRNGHEDVAAALIAGGADPKLTNGDGLTASMVAIANDRFDLAAKLVDLGASANDGSLYFAVDMHDATTDMRAHDGSRLRADHTNKMSSMDLIKFLLDKGADPNKPFQGQVHNTTLCCDPEVNSSPFYRAAIASDVDALKLMLAHGAKVDWSPAEFKKPGAPAGPAGAGGGGRGVNANVGKTPSYITMSGGRGAAFAAGPGFDRIGAPPFREAGNRDPVEALNVLLKAGADANGEDAGRLDAAASGGDGPAHGCHPRAGRRGCEARRRQQGQPDAAPARREAGSAAHGRADAAGSGRLQAAPRQARRRHCDAARADEARSGRSRAAAAAAAREEGRQEAREES